MSKSFAKAQILGHAGGDPVFQVSSNGYAVAKFSVATNEQRKNTQTGEYVEHASWHNVVAFDKLAEVVRDRVHKGDRVLFEGRLSTSNWEDKQSGQKRYRTDIIVTDISLLTPAPEPHSGATAAPAAANDSTVRNSAVVTHDQEDDISSIF
jgi:single-strand DNA-binding protein